MPPKGDLADWIDFMKHQGKSTDEIGRIVAEAILELILFYQLPDWLVEPELEETEETSPKDDDRLKKLNAKQLMKYISEVYGERLKFNELDNKIELDGKELICEEVYLDLAVEHNINASKTLAADVFIKLAKENSYHPVEDYLEKVASCVSPGTIDNLSTRYFGTKNPIYDIFLKRTLIGAVARIYQPGCKLDTALVLQGEQGIRKSTFFDVLGGEWFDDSMGDGKSKDDLLILHKSWIQEWGEIERVFSKRQAGELKAFLSRRKDTYRQPYARQSLEYPRRSIIVGSANDSQFLNDATGSRRFWIIPVEVGRIDLETLKKERDAIWSAAVFAYKQNESWWLSQSEEKLSHHNNEKFQIIDEWVAQVEHYIKDYQRVSITEILTRAFDYELNKIDRPTQMRVASILTSLGWKKVGQQQHQGKRQVVWQKPTPLGQSVAEVLPPETTENRTIVTPTIPNKSNDQISNKKENSSSMSDPKKEGEFVFEKVEKKIQQGVEVLPSHSEQGIEGAKPPATPAPTPDDKALPEPTKNSARLSKEQNTQGQRSRS